jgi:hypothetical protein
MKITTRSMFSGYSNKTYNYYTIHLSQYNTENVKPMQIYLEDK